MTRRCDAVLFDLLTALLDSWSLWNAVAGSEQAGQRWRAAYLDITYRTGRYRRYEDLVADAAQSIGLSPRLAAELGVAAERCLFVAGSAYDLFGTARVGLATYWHDRIGMTIPPDAPKPIAHHRTLTPLLAHVLPE